MTASRRSFVWLLFFSGLIISPCMGLRQSLGLFMLMDERPRVRAGSPEAVPA